MTTQASRKRSGPLRLLLVDDHPVVREGIKASLETRPDLRVVGQAGNGLEAVKEVRRLKPHLVLMDITMPGLNGLEATRLIQAESPETMVLILTVHDNSEYVRQVVRAGARGYILKDSSPEQLVRAIDTIRREGYYFAPEVSQALSEGYARIVQRPKEPATRPLSGRESEVLVLIAQGLGNKDIACNLALSLNSVVTFRKRIMRKLGINTVAGLTRFALGSGLIDAAP